MARKRAFLEVSAYHPLALLAVSHLLRQGESYGHRAGGATHFLRTFPVNVEFKKCE
jgi:hypothetical protein